MNLEIVRFTAEFSTSHEGVGRTLLDDLIKRIYCEMAPVDVYLYRAQQLGDGVTHFPVIIGEVAVEDSHLSCDLLRRLSASYAVSFVELGLKYRRDVILRAIESLPENERIVLSLYYYEFLNLKEIGTVLNITESRVSQK